MTKKEAMEKCLQIWLKMREYQPEYYTFQYIEETLKPRAYEELTGEELVHVTKYSYETCSNADGWKSV